MLFLSSFHKYVFIIIVADTYPELTGHCSEYFRCMNYFNPFSNPMRWVVLLSLSYSWGNKGTEEVQGQTPSKWQGQDLNPSILTHQSSCS